MFFRLKASGPRSYLQIVESRRDGARVQQHVIATIGPVPMNSPPTAALPRC